MVLKDHVVHDEVRTKGGKVCWGCGERCRPARGGEGQLSEDVGSLPLQPCPSNSFSFLSFFFVFCLMMNGEAGVDIVVFVRDVGMERREQGSGVGLSRICLCVCVCVSSPQLEVGWGLGVMQTGGQISIHYLACVPDDDDVITKAVYR